MTGDQESSLAHTISTSSVAMNIDVAYILYRLLR